MLLAIDIGNTNIAIGLFKAKRLLKRLRLATGSKRAVIYDGINKRLDICGIDAAAIEAVIISSVVPSASKVVGDIFKKQIKVKTILLGKDINVPIKNRYKKPEQVGQDRLVNSFACLKLYGRPAIIIDFGTATTFDYLDKKGAYCGGLITPGVEVSIAAFVSRTALLPKISLRKPKGLIGRETAESMRSGIVHGLSSMCDGIVEKIRKRYPPRPKVIATGGLAAFFAPYCRHIDSIDENLTLKGLYLIYHAIPTKKS